jgi:hypothetical protein
MLGTQPIGPEVFERGSDEIRTEEVSPRGGIIDMGLAEREENTFHLSQKLPQGTNFAAAVPSFWKLAASESAQNVQYFAGHARNAAHERVWSSHCNLFD